MLDIKFIRENAETIESNAKNKGYDVDVKKLLRIDDQRRKLIEEVDSLRAQRKEAAQKRDDQRGLELKDLLKTKEDELEKTNEDFYLLAREIPNLTKKDVPVGADESGNIVVKEVGDKPTFAFEARDHLDLGLANDLIDVESAAKVSGSRFAYLKNELVILEMALISHAFSVLNQESFVPVIPPVLINQKAVEGLGYPEYERGEGYKVDDQFLVGTAEHSIVPMFSDRVLSAEDLPQRYAGFSTAFRKEAGTYGKDTRGIFRVHQFDKLEMVSFVRPQDEDQELEYLLSLEEKLVKDLEIPYRVILMCTGDLGFPTAKKIDIEAWFPGQNQYRETHSASTTSTFQSRRLNIKYQEKNEKDFVCVLNATAYAIGRTLVAIMENYQQKDGSIVIPDVLQKYTGFKKIPQ